jgi:hypothetical protein
VEAAEERNAEAKRVVAVASRATIAFCATPLVLLVLHLVVYIVLPSTATWMAGPLIILTGGSLAVIVWRRPWWPVAVAVLVSEAVWVGFWWWAFSTLDALD